MRSGTRRRGSPRSCLAPARDVGAGQRRGGLQDGRIGEGRPARLPNPDVRAAAGPAAEIFFQRKLRVYKGRTGIYGGGVPIFALAPPPPGGSRGTPPFAPTFFPSHPLSRADLAREPGPFAPRSVIPDPRFARLPFQTSRTALERPGTWENGAILEPGGPESADLRDFGQIGGKPTRSEPL